MHATDLIAPTPRRWTRAEYGRMAELGLLDPSDKVELIDGEILTMAPHYSKHAATVMHVQNVLTEAFGHGFHVRVQMPFALDPMSEPEPDLTVIAGTAFDFLQSHPERAALVVEVSDSTISYDRRWKGSLYARAGVADFWILSLRDHRLEVYRDPSSDAVARYGASYARVAILGPGDEVTPLAAPGRAIDVSGLLPPESPGSRGFPESG